MFKHIGNLAIILSVAVGFTLIPADSDVSAKSAARPLEQASSKVSPEALLNADGTLRLDEQSSGSLDLSRWNVRIDAQRGPVFMQPESQEPVPLSSPDVGNWAAMGSGGGAANLWLEAVTVMGSDVYVGGYFSDLDNIGAADFVARWDGANWSALGDNGFGNGSISSGVLSLVASGNLLYVGGWFTNVNNGGSTLNAADYIAVWDTVGETWSALGSGAAGNGALNTGVTSIALMGSTVYAGGYFTNVNNLGASIPEADYVAQFSGGNWSALGSDGAGNGAIGNPVRALAVIGTDLYAGGQFINAQNIQIADYIARWDSSGSSWYALATGGIASLNDWVLTLATDGTVLYAGGSFYNVQNGVTTVLAADHIAKWTPGTTTWSALGSGNGGNGSLNSAVWSIALSGTNVYVGGLFTDVYNGSTPEAAADRIARFDTAGGLWYPLGSGAGGDGAIGLPVHAVAVSGSHAYAVGEFTGVNNLGTQISHAVYMAHFDGTDWSAMGGPQGAITDWVRAIAVSGTNVYVGGDFTNVVDSGVTMDAADYIARWDGSHWHALGSNGFGGGALSSEVNAIAVSGSDVYVGGSFQNITDSINGSIPEADYIAKFNTGTGAWSALGSDGAGGGSLTSTTLAIAVSGSNVYAGGYFTNVNNGGTPIPEADYLAWFNGTDWDNLGHNGSSDGSLNNFVSALAVSGSDLYVGGYFTDVSNNGAMLPAGDYVARWNGTNWSALGSGNGGNGSLNSNVDALAVSGSDVYVGGWFNDVYNGGSLLDAADYIAKFNTGSNLWSALDSGPGGEGSLSNGVLDLALRGTDVYAAGYFTDVGSGGGAYITAADFVAKFDGTDWSALSSDGGGNGSIGEPDYPWANAIAANNSHVYVGGAFWDVNNGGTTLDYADYIADWQTAPVTSSVIFKSQGANDGWVLESTETSGVGGSLDSIATTFRVGDDAADKQYRGIVSFNTASLPDNAVITKVTLKVKKQGLTGTDPFTTHGTLMAAIRKPYFGSAVTLANSDFQAALSKQVGFNSTPVSNWYSTNNNPVIWPYVNLTGTTQFRVRFTKDDNDDLGADYVRFYSGNASAVYRPQLIVEYYVP